MIEAKKPFTLLAAFKSGGKVKPSVIEPKNTAAKQRRKGRTRPKFPILLGN
jgi:hypothetical protein